MFWEHKWNYSKRTPAENTEQSRFSNSLQRNIRQRICCPFRMNEFFFCSFYHLSFVKFENGVLAFFSSLSSFLLCKFRTMITSKNFIIERNWCKQKRNEILLTRMVQRINKWIKEDKFSKKKNHRKSWLHLLQTARRIVCRTKRRRSGKSLKVDACQSVFSLILSKLYENERLSRYTRKLGEKNESESKRAQPKIKRWEQTNLEPGKYR